MEKPQKADDLLLKRDGYPVAVSLTKDDLTALNDIVEKTGLNKSDLMRRISRAGIQAIKNSGYRVTLPMIFAVEVPEFKISDIETGKEVAEKKKK